MNKVNYNINWSEYFCLDESSPSGLSRIRSKHGNLIENQAVGHKHFRKSGDPQSWEVCFNYQFYLIHRIIWVMVYGTIDTNLVIDHLDGNPFNNTITNLSLKNRKDNQRNRKQNSNNKTGITGVTLIKNESGQFYYKAEWVEIDGTRKRKHFSLSKLGEELAEDLAIKCRKEQIERLILEGANYTERHHGFVNEPEIVLESVRDWQIVQLRNN